MFQSMYIILKQKNQFWKMAHQDAYFFRLGVEWHSIPAGMKCPIHSCRNEIGNPFLQEWTTHSIPQGMKWYHSIPAGMDCSFHSPRNEMLPFHSYRKWIHPFHSCRNVLFVPCLQDCRNVMNETISKRLCQTYELNISAYVWWIDPNTPETSGKKYNWRCLVNIFLYNLLDIL